MLYIYITRFSEPPPGTVLPLPRRQRVGTSPRLAVGVAPHRTAKDPPTMAVVPPCPSRQRAGHAFLPARFRPGQRRRRRGHRCHCCLIRDAHVWPGNAESGRRLVEGFAPAGTKEDLLSPSCQWPIAKE